YVGQLHVTAAASRRFCRRSCRAKSAARISVGSALFLSCIMRRKKHGEAAGRRGKPCMANQNKIAFYHFHHPSEIAV
ncbi:hypothetical protein, partial [Cloacibacillus porcorum]